VTIIEIRPFRNDWKCFEARDVEPGFLEQEQAIDYAKSRACLRAGEIRILDSSGPLVRTIPFAETNRRTVMREAQQNRNRARHCPLYSPYDPPPPDAADPIFDYPHITGQTVIGGYVYRGSRIPLLGGIYVFADYLGPKGGNNTGRIWIFRYNGRNVSEFRDITSLLFPTRVGCFPLDSID